ncbi:MAG: hypothetical protein U0667_15125 [Chloroflexota bacterium]
MGQDDLQPATRSVRLGGEVAGDDDVEGHGMKTRAAEPDGAKTRASDDDVEGHGMKTRASDISPEGVGRVRVGQPDGMRTRASDDEDDVEGHRTR